MKLDPKTFLEVVRLSPLVSIDLLVCDPQGRVLLGLRANRPAQNTWFVPGGRIAKDERIAAALARVAHEELGIELDPAQAHFLGVYEHLYPDNFADEPGIGTHYIVLAHEVRLDHLPDKLPADQHHDFRWFTVSELLADPQVHPNTKAYFSTKN
ncbi:MAG TPA: GDP-mannose mannosyl hydrolase [Longilinea sp.]|nr:GDP-mannose mannosyl hydrolase [Longilinea sp.]